MTTPEARALIIARLSDCPDLAAPRRVWESLGRDYQNHPKIRAHKDAMKQQMEADNATSSPR